MLAIEIDGDTHAEKENYDLQRSKVLNRYGIRVIRYTDDEILNSIEGVYDDLVKKVNFNNSHNPPLPSLIREGVFVPQNKRELELLP